MNNIKWKKFLVPEIFDIRNTKSILKEQIVPGSGAIPYVTASEGNNSIVTYIKCPSEWIDKGNCIVIGGKTMVITYQEKDFCSNDSHNLALYLKNNNTEDYRIFLFLVTALNKSLKHKYEWGNSISSKKIQKDYIELPVDDNGTINWKYMQDRIAELEQDRIAELEQDRIAELDAYLKVTGLDDYELTDDDKNVLLLSLSLEQTSYKTGSLEAHHGLRWKKFKIKDILHIHSSARKFNAIDVTFGGIYPYVARGSNDNGIRGYITEDEKYLNPGKTFSFGQDTATIYYQEEPYFTGDKIKIMELKDHVLNEHIAQYLIPVIRKAFSGFSWGQSSFNEKILNEVSVILPIDDSNDPNWNYMERYIQAMEKIVIADVVKYKDNIIKATKKTVQSY